MKQRLLPLAFISLASTACLDFVEPEPAPLHEPEDAHISITAFQDSDSTIDVTGGLFPGFDENGTQRAVLRESVIAFGVTINPDTTIGGAFYYRRRLLVDDSTASIFSIDPPPVDGVPSRPVVKWFGFRKIGADTVRLLPGEDLVLHIEADLGTPQPEPLSHTWSLAWGTNTPRFYFSGEGAPPETLTVPAQYLSIPRDSAFTVRLSVSQSGLVFTPNYAASYHYLKNSRWTVLVDE